MIDFGVLTAFRKRLMGDEQLQLDGFDQKIHTSLPHGASFPYVVIELEEIWTSVRLGAETGYAKLKLKASTFSETVASRESLKIAEKIRVVMDGQIIDVSNGKRAMIRLSGSVIDMPSTTKPLMVQQYFEVLVRG
ncbi:MAG: hypothetical protein Q8S21_06750 [Candidatus Paracaedibacteraceae bacterium]|nr:hypothetical protein [Candidatus Paracaedibacteraceae bacterium]